MSGLFDNERVAKKDCSMFLYKTLKAAVCL